MDETVNVAIRQTLHNQANFEDVRQEVNLYLIKRFSEGFKPRDMKGWLFVTVKRMAARLERKLRDVDTVPLPDDLQEPVKVKPNEKHVKAIQSALNSMPYPYQVVVRGVYLEGRTLRELAIYTNDSEVTLRKRLERARKRLRRIMDV